MTKAKRKPETTNIRRSAKTKEQVQKFYILCNGITEKKYFKALCAKLGLQRTNVKSFDHNRLSLVKHVESLFKKKNTDYSIDKKERKYVFIVYDVDSMPIGQSTNVGEIQQQADNACHKCCALGYTYIVSNESFELWLLLHYENLITIRSLHRTELITKLEEHINDYNKTGTNTYECTCDSIEYAIANAKALEAKHNENACSEGRLALVVSHCNPYTNVFKLVEDLYELAQRQ